MKHFKVAIGTYQTHTDVVRKGKTIGPCPYCTEPMIPGHKLKMPTIEHIKPKSRFPKARGKIYVCLECNSMKGNKTLREFLAQLAIKNKALLEALKANNSRIDNISYLIAIGIDEE